VLIANKPFHPEMPKPESGTVELPLFVIRTSRVPHSVVPRATVGHGVGDGIQRIFSCRVAQGGFPPRAPTDPDVRN
jgi:hypothetical protein